MQDKSKAAAAVYGPWKLASCHFLLGKVFKALLCLSLLSSHPQLPWCSTGTFRYFSLLQWRALQFISLFAPSFIHQTLSEHRLWSTDLKPPGGVASLLT